MRPSVAVVVVVPKPERVADLVRGELPQARERPLRELRRVLVALRVRVQQALGDQVVLAHAQRAERDDALDDLAGARIVDRAAGAPAARRAVHPVDHVVARVERVHVGRQQLDAEGVLEARGLERLAPPARALEQRRADRLGRAGIEVVDDRLLTGRSASACGSVFSSRWRRIRRRSSGSSSGAERSWYADRDVAGARVVGARPVAARPAARRTSGGRAGSPPPRSRRRRRRPRSSGRRRSRPRPRRRAALRRPGRLLQHVGQLDLDLGVLREVEGARRGRRCCASRRACSCRAAGAARGSGCRAAATRSRRPARGRRDSAATVKPHSTERAKASRTARTSSGFVELARKS